MLDSQLYPVECTHRTGHKRMSTLKHTRAHTHTHAHNQIAKLSHAYIHHAHTHTCTPLRISTFTHTTVCIHKHTRTHCSTPKRQGARTPDEYQHAFHLRTCARRHTFCAHWSMHCTRSHIHHSFMLTILAQSMCFFCSQVICNVHAQAR